MDSDLKQWKNQLQLQQQQQQQQSEEQQPSAKIPRLLLEPLHHSASTAALPLFLPEPSSLSAFPDSTTTNTRFSGMGFHFSFAQRQELELQSLIFKYMLVGAPIPAELLLPFKKSLLSTPAACYLYPYQQYQHYQPAMLQSGYWGRNSVDPEPGRCRRTDGKKWRCSREILLGHKYCERHVHRGRNRSRKLVETPTPSTTEGELKTPNIVSALPITAAIPSGAHFTLSGPNPSTNFIQLNQSQRASENETGNGGILDGSHGQLLRQFFDDWPRANQDSRAVSRSGGPCLSISTPSDFSLKLSTGNGDHEPEYQDGNGRDWGTGWSSHQTSSSMGGPLAEALRSSTSNASPTSVLYELRRGTTSETSSLST